MVTCANCGKPREEHKLGAYTDGVNIGAPFLVCPSSTWKEAPASGQACIRRGHYCVFVVGEARCSVCGSARTS